MWNRLCFIRFLQVSQIFQRHKSDANKQDFENEFNLTCHAQSPPKTTGILTKVFSTSGPNLVALAWTGDELSRGQAQNGVNFDFEVKFDLEDQGQSPPKTIGILTKVFYICGPNLVILADTGHELSRGQARDWRTDGQTHTHRQTQATTIPEGQYWPRVKMVVMTKLRSHGGIDLCWTGQANCKLQSNALMHGSIAGSYFQCYGGPMGYYSGQCVVFDFKPKRRYLPREQPSTSNTMRYFLRQYSTNQFQWASCDQSKRASDCMVLMRSASDITKLDKHTLQSSQAWRFEGRQYLASTWPPGNQTSCVRTGFPSSGMEGQRDCFSSFGIHDADTRRGATKITDT